MEKSADVLNSGGGFHGGALDDDAGAGEFPQGDEQLSGEGDDEPLARGLAAHAGKPLTIPARQRRLRLMDEPQPGKLKPCLAQPRIAGLRHPLLMGDRSAAPRRRREASISARLPAVGESAAKPFGPKDRREFRPDPFEPRQEANRRRRRGFGADVLPAGEVRKKRLTLPFDRPDLLEQQLEPVKLAQDLRSQVFPQRPAVAGAHLDDPLAAIAGATVDSPLPPARTKGP